MASISTAAADSKTDALQIIDRWAKAFSASDVDAIVKLYAPDALFMGTGSKVVVTKPEGIRTYFENALLNNRPRGATLNSHESMVLSDNAVLVTGLDTVTGVRDGNPTSASGRVTFVVAKRGADWQIVHFHWSAMPQ
ncbi:SgcJ/EcaC family oxidoreductase [Leptospira interrogans]